MLEIDGKPDVKSMMPGELEVLLKKWISRPIGAGSCFPGLAPAAGILKR